jgi:beta-xylosidase
MNRRETILTTLLAGCTLAAGFLAACASPERTMPENPVISNFIADPSAHAFGDRVYLYLTNDSANSGTYWDSRDWRLFSSDDLNEWEDHGVAFSLDDLTWADSLAWAPGAVERNGTYYLYLPVERTKMAVVTSESPTGPFMDTLGEPLIDNSRDAKAGDEPIDPMVFVDDDEQAYMYFGTRVPKVVKLADDMVHTEGPIMDVELDSTNYGEAPWLHERDGVYYFSYSTGWPGQIVYATGPGPLGPFTYQGVVLDYPDTSTNHHAIVNYDGDWYIFYHNASLPGGGDYKRSVHVDHLQHGDDGRIEMLVPKGGTSRGKSRGD